MTKATSEYDDNNGLCEGCNRPETENEIQRLWPVYLAGGLGWGTMFLCPECYDKTRDRVREGRHSPNQTQIDTVGVVYRKERQPYVPVKGPTPYALQPAALAASEQIQLKKLFEEGKCLHRILGPWEQDDFGDWHRSDVTGLVRVSVSKNKIGSDSWVVQWCGTVLGPFSKLSEAKKVADDRLRERGCKLIEE